MTVNCEADGDRLLFRVSDTGIGIRSDDIDKLFHPFSRAEDLGARKQDGTGLGLVLSKRLAQALGGDVILESSEFGRGSKFLFTVEVGKPYAGTQVATVAPAPIPLKKDSVQELAGRKILVVEDSPDNQLLLRLFLSKHKMQIDFASNGEEGMTKALAADYDIILMDMQMPVMDGYTATRLLREKGYVKPIVALTAHAMKEDRELCLKAGCDDYLTKPIEPNSLYGTISKYLNPDSTKSLAQS